MFAVQHFRIFKKICFKQRQAQMILYFEFEEQRRKAEVQWPRNAATINVEVTDYELAAKLPVDLIFDINKKNKVTYTIESPDNKRLNQLQKIICKRLQEFAN